MSSPLVDSAGIFNRALAIYREHANVLFPAGLIVALLSAMFLFFTRQDAPVVALVLAVPALIAWTFFQAIVVEVARDVQDGRAERGVDELLRSAVPIAPRLLLVTVLSGLGAGLGYMLLIVPGLILFTIWAVAAPVVVIERPRALDAFRRSVELVRGYGWPVFGLLLLVFAIVLVVAVVSAIIAVPLGGVDGVAGQFVQLLASAVVIPVLPLVTVVLYFRLVELHAEQAIAGPAAAPAPTPDADPTPAPDAAPTPDPNAPAPDAARDEPEDPTGR